MKKLIFIMPLMAVSLLASCGGSKEPTKVSYTLTYTYDNGSADKYVETYAEDKKTVEPTWEPTNPGFTFGGWFTKSGEEGAQFTFGNVLTDNTVVYAHWSKTPEPKTTYHLTFNGTNCKMDGTDKYEEDIPIGASTQRKIYPNEGYALPVLGKDEELTITGQGASSVSYEDGNIIITKFSGDVVITANPSKKEYTVHFDAKDGNLDSQAQEDITVAHGTMFKNIDNYVNQKATKSGCLFKGWSLSPTDITTISEDYVFEGGKDLYAVFTPTTTIAVKLSNDSLNCALSTMDGQEVTPGGSVNIPIGIKTTLIVSPVNNYLPIFSKNLEVTGATEYKFDQATKELTITVNSTGCEVTAKTSYLSKGELNNYSWKEISEISEAGGASAAFKVGNEKIVKVNDLEHRVRIIDFDQDDLADSSGKAGITFEFANVITNSSGPITKPWDNRNNYDYRASTINDFLNNETPGKESVINMLPSDSINGDLKEVIKPVNKKVGVSINKDTAFEALSFEEGKCPKLFLLAYNELHDLDDENVTPNETNDIYEYYKGHGGDELEDMSYRLKEAANKPKTRDYWLRSPFTGSFNVALFVTSGGALHHQNALIMNYTIAPAFCI